MDIRLNKVIKSLVGFMACNNYHIINCINTPRTKDSYQIHYVEPTTKKVLVICLFMRCDRIIAETLDVDTCTTINVVNGLDESSLVNILVL